MFLVQAPIQGGKSLGAPTNWLVALHAPTRRQATIAAVHNGGAPCSGSLFLGVRCFGVPSWFSHRHACTAFNGVRPFPQEPRAAQPRATIPRLQPAGPNCCAVDYLRTTPSSSLSASQRLRVGFRISNPRTLGVQSRKTHTKARSTQSAECNRRRRRQRIVDTLHLFQASPVEGVRFLQGVRL